MQNESLKQIIQKFLSFPRHERKGLLFLCILLLAVILANYLMDIPRAATPTDFSEIKRAMEHFEKERQSRSEKEAYNLFPFDPNTISEELLDSLDLPEKVKSNIARYRRSGGKFYQPSALRKIYGMNDSLFALLEPYILIEENRPSYPPKEVFAPKPDPVPTRFIFNPNTATADDLLLLGFSRYQVSNIEKYRSKGGQFKNPSELYKLYGADTSLIEELLPWIQIPEEKQKEKGEMAEVLPMVELNSADSAQLTGIKGIGPAFASRIIRYRKRLGGFIQKEQLMEIYGITSEKYQSINNQVWTDSTKIEKIRLNFADFQTLLKHPYLSKEDAGNIIRYRSKHGPYKSIEILSEKNIVGSETFLKVKFYLEAK